MDLVPPDLRNKKNDGLNDIINCKEFSPDFNKKINKMNFSIRIKSNSKKIFTIHEEELKEIIKKNFNNFNFCDSQVLLLTYQKENIVMDVTCKDYGIITPDCEITFDSNDVLINLISSKLLKRDLFHDNYNFEDIGIGGLNLELIDIFRRSLSTRAIKKSIAEKLGVRHVKGILLYGPPGTGKTLIARKIGGLISHIEPKIVNGPEIMNKYIGQSEENIRNLFKEAIDDHKKNSDDSNIHVIIFDEIDAICKERGSSSTQSNVTDSIVTQLLSFIDGVNQINNIFIIAMTNRKDLLDPALLRAGRIEVHIQIGLPDQKGREQICVL